MCARARSGAVVPPPVARTVQHAAGRGRTQRGAEAAGDGEEAGAKEEAGIRFEYIRSET